MAISFGDARGNLFNRLGSLGGLLTHLRDYQLLQLAAMTDTTYGVTSQYDAESDIQAEMGSQYLSVLSSAGGNVLGIAQQMAGDTVNRAVYRDNAKLGQTLTSADLLTSVLEVIRQMGVAGATVLAQTVTTTPSSFTGRGLTSVVNSSTRRPLDGRVLENAFAETINVVCSADSYVGGAEIGNEGFSVTGQGGQTDVSAFDWPKGSDCSVVVNAIDGDQDVSAGNLLTNSGFTDWTDDVPDNFELVVGTAGTDVTQETTIVFDSSLNSLQMTGDGSTLTQLTQLFDDSTGTTGALSALTQYSFCVFMKRDGTAAGQGTLVVDLIDQNDAVILDQGGTANSLTVDLTALTTQFTAYLASFRLPLIMPTTVRLRIRQTVALESGRAVYLDRMSLGLMSQCYVGGPFVAVHSGAQSHVQGDYATLTVTNSRGAAGTLATWQTCAFRLLPVLQANEILLPSSATPTLSDGLIA